LARDISEIIEKLSTISKYELQYHFQQTSGDMFNIYVQLLVAAANSIKKSIADFYEDGENQFDFQLAQHQRNLLEGSDRVSKLRVMLKDTETRKSIINSESDDISDEMNATMKKYSEIITETGIAAEIAMKEIVARRYELNKPASSSIFTVFTDSDVSAGDPRNENDELTTDQISQGEPENELVEDEPINGKPVNQEMENVGPEKEEQAHEKPVNKEPLITNTDPENEQTIIESENKKAVNEELVIEKMVKNPTNREIGKKETVNEETGNEGPVNEAPMITNPDPVNEIKRENKKTVNKEVVIEIMVENPINKELVTKETVNEKYISKTGNDAVFRRMETYVYINGKK